MKLRNITSKQFKNAVVKLLSQPTPIKTTLLLEDMVKLLNAEIEKFDAARQVLLDAYGTKDDEGKLAIDENRNVKISEENMGTYTQAYNSLCDTEVEVPALNLADLGDKVVLSYDDLQILRDLIVR